MGKAQESKRCPFGCGIVPVHHSCHQRPQSKMRGETKGLTTGPQWTANDWAVHLKAKAEPVAKPVAAGALEHGGKVLAGDTWASTMTKLTLVVIRVEGMVHYRLKTVLNGGLAEGLGYADERACLVENLLDGPYKLISRAQKAERALGEFKDGDQCVARHPASGWRGERCVILEVRSNSPWPYYVKRHDGVTGQLKACELELVEPVKEG